MWVVCVGMLGWYRDLLLTVMILLFLNVVVIVSLNSQEDTIGIGETDTNGGYAC
jgi:hypothetical protein